MSLLSFQAFVAHKQLTQFMRAADVFQKGEVIGSLENFSIEIGIPDGETDKDDPVLSAAFLEQAPKFWDAYVKDFAAQLDAKGLEVILVVPDDRQLNPSLLVKGIFKISDGHKFYFFAPALKKLGLKVRSGTCPPGVTSVDWPDPTWEKGIDA